MSDLLNSRGVECDRVPQYVERKAEQLLLSLEQGVSLVELRGQRLHHDRTWISFALDRCHRAVAKDFGHKILLIRVMTHETYNKWLGRR